jgi:hypothetical protein
MGIPDYFLAGSGCVHLGNDNPLKNLLLTYSRPPSQFKPAEIVMNVGLFLYIMFLGNPAWDQQTRPYFSSRRRYFKKIGANSLDGDETDHPCAFPGLQSYCDQKSFSWT